MLNTGPAQTSQPPSLFLEEEMEDYLALFLPRHIRERGLRAMLLAWRNRRLWETVARARRESLFYRRLWREITPLLDAWNAKSAAHASMEVDALPFLHRLPFTTAADIAAGADGFLAVSHDDVAGLVSVPTSGSSGPPKRIFCTAADLERTVRFFQYGMRHMLDPQHKESVALLMSGDRPGSVGHLLQVALARWNIPCRVLGAPDALDACAEALAKLTPSCIVALPAHMLALSRHPLAGHIAKDLHIVLLSGDASSPEERRHIGLACNCRVFTHYGLTESGFGGAVECREHLGGHIREADIFFEIVDALGRPLPDGAWGEIAMTTLSREAMPLVRYKTGDAGRLIPGLCPCGSILGRLETRGRLIPLDKAV